MATYKFYNIRDAVQQVVRRHAEGNPMNPAGFRISGLIIGYTDNNKGYRDSNCIRGSFIRAGVLGDFIKNINKALDDNLEVLVPTASFVGNSYSVSLKRLSADEREEKASAKAQEIEKPTEPELPEEVKEAVAKVEAVETEQPIEEPSGDTEIVPDEESPSVDEAQPTSEVDWDYAEAIVKRDGISKKDAKEELAAYALDNFGVELSTGKKFENMIKDFKGATND